LTGSFSQLVAAAADGPVVVVNTSQYRDDALILTPSGLQVLPLELVSMETEGESAGSLRTRTAQLWEALRTASRTPADIRWADGVLSGLLGWLWDTIAEPVLTALGMTTGTQPDQELPRVWWCPTGWLSFLPLHAAGRYPAVAAATSAGGTDCPTGTRAALPECAVSSYTPTLRALIDARGRAGTASPTAAVLGVALAHTPGLADLPAAEPELAQLRQRIPAATVLTGEQATRAAILHALPDCSCLHFAGHGGQDPLDPASAALYCHDHQSNGPIRVADIARLRPRDAQLAFLSACDSAKGTARLADEAIHIAGAVHLAGFTHVIATQWTISDPHAPDIADHVYQHLTAASHFDEPAVPGLDTRRSATALHAAVRDLRGKQPQRPTLWAPYLHIGP
jgi:hypothetical protein